VSNDPLVCRKLVSVVEADSYRSAIETWPFLTFAGATTAPPTALVSVIDGFKSAGYDPEVIDTFSKWISAPNARLILRESEPPQQLPQSRLEHHARRVIPPVELPHRLGRLQIKDFRGIRKLEIDLSADLTVVHGRNGTGKTSLFDCLEWALLGEVEHLGAKIIEGDSRSPYVNLFSEDGSAQVNLQLDTSQGSVTLMRSIGLEGSDLVEYNGRTFTDNRPALIEILGEQARDLSIDSLRELVRSSNFLAQATLRRFFSKKPGERYAAVSHLLGTHDYSKFLNKLNEVIRHFEKHLVTTAKDVALLDEELSAKRSDFQRLTSQMVNSPEGLELDARLQDTVQLIAAYLADFKSEISRIPVTQPFLFEEVKAFLEVAEQWHDVTKAALEKRQRDLAFLEQSRIVLDQQEQQSKVLRGELLSVDARIQTLKTEFQNEELRRRTLDAEIVTFRSELRSATEANVSLQTLRNLATSESELAVTSGTYSERVNALTHKEQTMRAARDIAQEYISRSVSLREQLKRQVQTLQGTLQRLYTLQVRIGELVRHRSEAKEVRRTLDNEETSTSGWQHELGVVTQEHDETFTKLDSAFKALKDLRNGLEQYRGLVSTLQSYIRDGGCPLCGQKYESIEELRQHIRSTIEADPPELQRLDNEVQTLRQKLKLIVDAQDQLRTKIAGSAATIRASRNRLEQLDAALAEIRQLCVQAGFGDVDPQEHDVTQKQRDTEAALGKLSSQLAEVESNHAAKSGEVAEIETQLRFASEQRVEAERASQSVQRELATVQNSRASRMKSLSVVDMARIDEQARQIADRLRKAMEQTTSAEQNRAVHAGRIANIQAELESAGRQKAAKEEQLRTLSLEVERLKTILSQMSDGMAQAVLADEKAAAETTFGLLANILSVISKAKQLASWLLARRQAQAIGADIERLNTAKEQLDNSWGLDQRWSRHLKELSEAITKVRHDAENRQLETYAPSISNLYKRFSAHPIFGDIKASVDPEKEEVRITAEVSEFLAKYIKHPFGSLAPLRYFSEAQGNVLALSVFLSNAFQQRWSKVNSIFMDDPVQNMDDLNANAFIDTLRALTASTGKQFVVATCDVHLYKLMLVKLGCLNSAKEPRGKKRFSAYRLNGVSVNGPELISDL
jgi:DNA repair exonuclease SbcCD ATPase subunit